MKLKIVLFDGGDSKEREVSFNTSKTIVNNLDNDKYDITKITIPKNLNDNEWVKKLIEDHFDLAIIAIHGGIGENGSLQGLLDCLNIPYIGSKVLGSAIGMNKYLTKQLLELNGIKTPKGGLFSEYKSLNFDEPCIIKPIDDGSSFGVIKINSLKEIDDKKITDNYLIEEFIDGVEITCGIYEENNNIIALDVLEIKPNLGFYDYNAKYKMDTVIEKSLLSNEMKEKVQNIAKNTFKVLNAHGYARVDMILKDNDAYVLEINTLPGLTDHSLFPKALKMKDINLQKFLDILIENELK